MLLNICQSVIMTLGYENILINFLGNILNVSLERMIFCEEIHID